MGKIISANKVSWFFFEKLKLVLSVYYFHEKTEYQMNKLKVFSVAQKTLFNKNR